MSVETLIRPETTQPQYAPEIGVDDPDVLEKAKKEIDEEREKLLANPVESVLKSAKMIYRSFPYRRSGETIEHGSAVLETDTVATRTANRDGIDEIHTIDMIFDESKLKEPKLNYTAQMRTVDGLNTITINPEGILTVSKTVGEEEPRILKGEEQNDTLIDYFERCEIATMAIMTRDEKERRAADASSLELLTACDGQIC